MTTFGSIRAGTALRPRKLRQRPRPSSDSSGAHALQPLRREKVQYFDLTKQPVFTHPNAAARIVQAWCLP